MPEVTRYQDLSITIDGITCQIPAPYCSADEWAARTGMQVSEIKERLKKGQISRYQVVPKGFVYVNVINEFKKTIQTAPWN